MSQFVTLGTVR